jgi:hypothetical protein
MIGQNADYSVLTVVQDATGEIATLHYLKNTEISNLPDAVR